MAAHHIPTFALTISLALALLCLMISTTTTSSSINAANDHTTNGFSVRLIHRDSTDSPFYNSHETPSQRMSNAAKRSIARAHRFSNMLHHLNSSPNKSIINTSPAASVDLISNYGDYLMNISIGTPPFPILAAADTGSDITWTQCKPCTNCYKQNAPLFDPASSSTYKTASCKSKPCVSLFLDGSFCSANNTSVCQFRIVYGDESQTKGDVAVDTLTLASSTLTGHVAFPNFVIGCGRDNTGTFNATESGIVGLGGGPGSLISQMGPTIGGKFSYCMVPYAAAPGRTTSTMHFGQNAVVLGTDVVSTPLLSSPYGEPTFYSVRLDSVTVGSKNIPFEGDSPSTENSGNIIVDSGTTLTLVPTDFFSKMSDAVESQVVGKRTEDPEGILSLCYLAGDSLKYVPPVTMHFQGGEVALAAENILYPMRDTVVCLAFQGLDDDLSIYGNVAQQNFVVGFDVQKRTVSFKPADCTKN